MVVKMKDCHEPGRSVSFDEFVQRVGLSREESEARRLIKQRGVKLDGNVVENANYEVEISSPMVLKVGKRRFMRLIPKE